MSIDTYDTMAILKPGAPNVYDLSWMERLIVEVIGPAGAAISRTTLGEATGWKRSWRDRLTDLLSGLTTANRARRSKFNVFMALPCIVIRKGDATLKVTRSEMPYMATEYEDIAAEYGAPCRGSKVRFGLYGTDLDLVLENDHQAICERLHETGDFILFSSQNGLLFEDPADQRPGP